MPVVASGAYVCVVAAVCGVTAAHAADDRAHVRIIAGAETHGMVYPCDCEHEPGGGLAARAHLVDSIRGEREVLLLDAGGFAGGGLYDGYTEGRKNDSLRTLAAMKAMAMMGYDVVGIGDDDLQYGAAWLASNARMMGLPLVCANCRTTQADSIVPRFMVVEKNGVRFAITAVAPPLPLVQIDSLVVITDPFDALRGIAPSMEAVSDVQIVLSHQGEEQSRAIADSIPSFDIIVNAHRKKSVLAAAPLHGAWMMQFGFQGKKLSYADIAVSGGRIAVRSSGWMEVGAQVAPDARINDTIAAVLAGCDSPMVTIDLYIMSECPYGLDALRQALPLAESFPGTVFNVWFIGDIDENGVLRSLHGEAEIEEEKIWCAVRELYPRFYNDFCVLRASGAAVQDIIRQMGLDSVAISGWAAHKGEAAVRMHYSRSMRLSVRECPTLFFNNSPIEPGMERLRVAKMLCARTGIQKPVCDSLPECFSDIECRKAGFHGACGAASGRCEYAPAARFDFIVLKPDTSEYDYTNDPAILTTRDLFPGVNVRLVDVSSSEGRRLAREIRAVNLPVYVFGAGVEGDRNFGKVKDGLTRAGRWLTFKESIMRKRYFPQRPKRRELALYIDPLFNDIGGILQAVLALDPGLRNVSIYPIIYYRPGSGDVAGLEQIRHEEAARWLALAACHRESFAPYLRAYRRIPPPEYRRSVMDSLGLEEKTLDCAGRHSRTMMKRLWNDMKTMEIRGPIELLFNNVELLPVRNPDELMQAIGRFLQAADVPDTTAFKE